MLKFAVLLGENPLADSDLNYTFTCPSCAGSFSILLERIPPVQARFRCPHCKQPMDFPSREEARVYARLQSQPGPSPAPAPATASPAPSPAPTRAPAAPEIAHRETSSAVAEKASVAFDEASAASENVRFRVEKPGFEADIFDRRAMRNLIRSGEIVESDRVRVEDAEPVVAGSVSFLKGLFGLRKSLRVSPPACCRTHTDRVAHFKCRDSLRPLCEECAPERKFGATIIRVCSHCGGTAAELVDPATI